MSRTNKTTPLWARLKSDPAHLAKEHHDHRLGPCDLPPRPDHDNTDAPATRCYWEPSTTALFGKDSGCPCPVCRPSAEYRENRRRDRHQSHQATHRMEGAVDEDLLDE